MSIGEKLKTIAENQVKLYDMGKQAEYNAFWDSILVDGLVPQFRAFGGRAWNNDTFRPNQNLVIPNWSQQVFNWTGEIDLVARLSEKNLKIDFSKCAEISYFTERGDFTTLPEMDVRTLSTLKFFIYYCQKLVSIEKVILKDDGSQTFANTSFGYNEKLKQVIFEGCIGSDFSIAQSPLNAESGKSIINCLKDYSGTDKEFTYTLSLSSTAKANLEAEGNTAPNGLTWLEYAQAKGWNIG